MTKEELINQTLEDLRGRYPIGLYEYLYVHRRELYEELITIENKIDMAFLSGPIEELKSALRDYWTLHMKAIRIFNESNQRDMNLNEVREEMREERIQA